MGLNPTILRQVQNFALLFGPSQPVTLATPLPRERFSPRAMRGQQGASKFHHRIGLALLPPLDSCEKMSPGGMTPPGGRKPSGEASSAGSSFSTDGPRT